VRNLQRTALAIAYCHRSDRRLPTQLTAIASEAAQLRQSNCPQPASSWPATFDPKRTYKP